LITGLLIVGILFVYEPAFAHGGKSVIHAPVELQDKDPEHAEKGHPGHCHGGSFCTGVAVAAPGSDLPVLFSQASRRSLPRGCFKLMAVTSFDPPPPRRLS
jgi:hypothetical protein